MADSHLSPVLVTGGTRQVPASPILVTGGTGFLGRHVVDLLRARGADVRIVARSQGSSVLDPASLEKAAAGCRLVLHLAGKVDWAPDAEDLFPLHVDGTRNVIRAARAAGARRVVHVSTSGTVGISEDLDHVATEDSPYVIELARRWPYYQSKIFAEKVALEEQARSGIEVVVVSPALLLGPGSAEGNEVVARFLRREIPAVPPGVASVVDVRDAAQAVIAAAERGTPGARYLLGTNLSFEELMDGLERASGVPRPKLKIPAGARGAMDRATAALGFLERAVGYSGGEAASLAASGFSWAVDDGKARRELGYAPRPLDETLAAAVDAVLSAEALEGRPAPQGVLSFARDGVHRLAERLNERLSRRAPAPPPGDEERPDRSS